MVCVDQNNLPPSTGPAASFLLEGPQAWKKQGSCYGLGAHAGKIFFPPPGSSHKEAKAICGSCPVQAECLEYAMKHPAISGIWGGLNEKERKTLRRRRQRERRAANGDQ
jgi:WhiB family redox-sensing transcriptional regulator